MMSCQERKLTRTKETEREREREREKMTVYFLNGRQSPTWSKFYVFKKKKKTNEEEEEEALVW